MSDYNSQYSGARIEELLAMIPNLAKADLSNAMTVNLNQNGYVKFNNGLLVQWGRVGGSSTAPYSVTMPTSFYNTEYKIFATVYKPSSDSAIYSASPLATNKTVSRFYLNRNLSLIHI